MIFVNNNRPIKLIDRLEIVLLKKPTRKQYKFIYNAIYYQLRKRDMRLRDIVVLNFTYGYARDPMLIIRASNDKKAVAFSINLKYIPND